MPRLDSMDSIVEYSFVGDFSNSSITLNKWEHYKEEWIRSFLFKRLEPIVKDNKIVGFTMDENSRGTTFYILDELKGFNKFLTRNNVKFTFELVLDRGHGVIVKFVTNNEVITKSTAWLVFSDPVKVC